MAKPSRGKGSAWHLTAPHGTAYHVMVTYCNVASAALTPLWLSHAVAVTLISQRLAPGRWGLSYQVPTGLAVLYCIWEMSRVLSHTHLHRTCTFMRPGPEFPVRTGIGSGWACHRDPLFQNQPFLA